MLLNKSLQVIAIETLTPGIESMLSEHDFERVFYEPFQRVLSADQIGFPASNAVFVRDVSFVADRVRQSSKIEVLNYLI